MRELLVEWMESASDADSKSEDWISMIRIDHHNDREIVGWAIRMDGETSIAFAERIFAVAQNDAEAIGSGDQLYMLRVFRAGSNESQERRPLRVFHGFAEHLTHSLAGLPTPAPDPTSDRFRDAVQLEVNRRLRAPLPVSGTFLFPPPSPETPEETAAIDEEARSVLRDLQGQLKMASAAGAPCGEAAEREVREGEDPGHFSGHSSFPPPEGTRGISPSILAEVERGLVRET